MSSAAVSALAASFRQPDLLAAIAEATDDVIFAKDAQGRYQFANRATLATVGRVREDVIGRTDAEFMADPEVAKRVMANDRLVLAGASLDFEESMRLADGQVHYWLSRKMPLRDESGRIVGLLGIAREITTRKLAEAQAEADRL